MRTLRARNAADPALQGSALMASLAVVTVVAMLGAGLVQVQSAITRRQALGIDRTRALYVAEAGLSEAYLAMAQGRSGNVGSAEVPAIYDNGVYWVEATDNPDGSVTLRSTGLCGRGRFSVEVVVDPRVNPIGDLGLFAQDLLEIGEGAVIDSFDSRLGSLASQLDPLSGEGGTLGRVRSNGDVTLRGWPGALGDTDPTRVLGEVRPGPDGVLSMDPGVTVTGATAPIPSLLDLPSVQLPVLPLSLLNLPLRLREVQVGPGELAQSSITVPTGVTAVLKGPLVVVTRSVQVAPGAALRFDATDGAVVLYVANSFVLETGSTVQSVGDDPTQVSVLLPGAPEVPNAALPIRLNGTGSFLGTFYAPENSVRVPAGLHMVGTIGARELVLAPDAHVTFDRALLDSGSAQNPAPQLVAWTPVPPPNVPIVRSILDPVRFLQDQAVSPVQSSRGATETQLKIHYVDTAGVEVTWSGAGTDMDWTDVSYVIELVWFDPNTLTDRLATQPPGGLRIGL